MDAVSTTAAPPRAHLCDVPFVLDADAMTPPPVAREGTEDLSSDLAATPIVDMTDVEDEAEVCLFPPSRLLFLLLDCVWEQKGAGFGSESGSWPPFVPAVTVSDHVALSVRPNPRDLVSNTRSVWHRTWGQCQSTTRAIDQPWRTPIFASTSS